jgi:glycyl-radical enzyme activating protein
MRLTGMVTDVQRCSLHDGPGLRTTVFLKGCQLNCPWCHNPEAISFELQEMYYPEKCIGCRQCDKGCYSGARVLCGLGMTVADILKQVEQDKPYYGEDGGVTVSGGEPLCQMDFVLELAGECKARGINIGIESNLCFPVEYTRPVLETIDLLMADLKFWDSEDHKKWTGMGNGHVRENLWQAAGLGLPIILRTPVIPGVNDDPKQIESIAGFAATLPTLKYYELLAYHPLGEDKARALGKDIQRFDTPSAEELKRLADIAAKKGVWVMINGHTHKKPE